MEKMTTFDEYMKTENVEEIIIFLESAINYLGTKKISEFFDEIFENFDGKEINEILKKTILEEVMLTLL